MKTESVFESSGKGFVSQFLYGLHPARLLPTITSSLMVWLIALVLAISFSALIFQGRLAPYYGAGISIALVSGIVISLMMAMFGSDRATLAYPQSSVAVIMGAMSTNLIAMAPPGMPDEALFLTVMLAISLTSMLTGLFFLIMGVMRAGNLIRYIPYPVIGGFLAGSGWLLVQGALNVMVGMQLTPGTLITLAEGSMLAHWLPGLLLGIMVVWLQRRTGSVLVIPLAIMGALVLFYAVVFASSSTMDTATQQGWFLQEFTKDTLWRPLDLNAITRIDGPMVIAQAGSMAAVIIISTLHMLMNSSGLELVVDRELNLNHELRIIGAGNSLSSLLGGGIVGFPSMTFSTLVHRMGGSGRVVGMILAILLGLTLLFGASFITLFPRVILGGLLMYLGLHFLVEWLYDAWFKLPFKDYLIMLVILLVIGTMGFLEGVAVGFAATVLLFVMEYSQISIVKQEFSGSVLRSNIDRSYEQNALLRDLGQYIWVLRLQGFIFFGTSHQFYQRIKARVHDPEREAILYVILDFRLVRGIDVSAVVDFTRLKQLAKTHGFHLLLTDVAPEIQEVLVDCGFGAMESDVSSQYDDMDHAMEWCENELLAHTDLKPDGRVTLQEQFDSRTMYRVLNVGALAKYLERVDVNVGEYVVHQDDEPDAMYFIESGRVDIQLEMEGGKAVRLRSMSAGTIVGEVGFYLGAKRSASIVVTEPGVFYKLSRTALRQMENDDPESAASFHVFIVCVVAERLTGTNHMVQALMN